MFRILTAAVLLVFLTACHARSTDIPDQVPTRNEEETEEAETMKQKLLTLTIDGTKIPVQWYDNPSVQAITEAAAQEPITVEMKKFEDFEQFGALGSTFPSDDHRITTTYGDIELYCGNQIVVFYGSNTWEYTELGKMQLTKEELDRLLGNEEVILVLTTE